MLATLGEICPASSNYMFSAFCKNTRTQWSKLELKKLMRKVVRTEATMGCVRRSTAGVVREATPPCGGFPLCPRADTIAVSWPELDVSIAAAPCSPLWTPRHIVGWVYSREGADVNDDNVDESFDSEPRIVLVNCSKESGYSMASKCCTDNMYR